MWLKIKRQKIRGQVMLKNLVNLSSNELEERKKERKKERKNEWKQNMNKERKN